MKGRTQNFAGRMDAFFPADGELGLPSLSHSSSRRQQQPVLGAIGACNSPDRALCSSSKTEATGISGTG